MLAVNTDPAFSPLFTRHDLMVGVGRLEKSIGTEIKVPSDAASPSAPLDKGTQESARR
jgi:hypothetical protein